ncbi:MAG: preprotein translocase subunit Tim44 [Ponticaulis sp.]|nr:preprotein translocase subunit Tim44 [Ponticaulis sp.]|tara:strand:+ start:1928 stop:2512 length:585 start_codon:yes stop_codon:yes gene_type:complete
MSVEILFLAGVAIFVLARLFSVLGKQKGAPPPSFRTPDQAERPHPVLVHSDSEAEDEDADNVSGLQQISRMDPNFSQREFIQGARAAYEMIVQAFAEGDRKTLKSLLTSDIFEDYDTAIKAREESGAEPMELMRLKNASIEEADLKGSVAEITVHYEAELSNGERITQTRELWTYERDLKSKDPNWRLADVSEA